MLRTGVWIALAFVTCFFADPPILLFDGFEGSGVAAFWLPGSSGSGRHAPRAVTISNKYARTGKACLQITLRQGDVAQRSDDGTITERAEMDSGAHPFLGSEVWCGFSFLIPRGFPIVDNRLVIAQWKQKDIEGPQVAQRFRNGRHHLTIRTPEGEPKQFDLPSPGFEKWNDMIYHVRFSEQNDGLVEVWMNGTRVVSSSGVTALPGGRNAFYNKFGLYRDSWKEPMTIFFDNYTLGSEFAIVDPARFDSRSAR